MHEFLASRSPVCLVGLLVLGLVGACAPPRAEPPRTVSEGTAPFELEWDPKTGRGSVTQRIPGDGSYRLCLSCVYPGYTGGLWVGSQSASGLEWTPEKPPRGFANLNLFCAQDETIWEPQAGLGYEPGWSQNFGRGDDGVSLGYLGGEVLDDGSTGQGLTLSSVNAGGCYRETRYLHWPQGKPYLLIALYVQNTCARSVEFEFWTGEDPWIGRYATSEGDVGWTPAGVVRRETALAAGGFTVAGFYDLGNELLGEGAAPFSNVANFLALDPSSPRPSQALFANSFAHSPADLNPQRPLDNDSLTALNLGWTGLSLKPGEEFRLAYALGRAETGEAGSTPVAPTIGVSTWGFDVAWHRAAAGRWAAAGQSGGPQAPLQFRDEIIRVVLDPPLMRVEALYTFLNPREQALNATLFYPFPLGTELDYPTDIKVEGARFKRAEGGLLWRLRAGPAERVTVEVSYTQRCKGRLARYILTSTSFWNRALESGRYRVDWPSSLGGVTVSFAGRHGSEGDRDFVEWSAEDFLPTKDLVVTW